MILDLTIRYKAKFFGNDIGLDITSRPVPTGPDSAFYNGR